MSLYPSFSCFSMGTNDIWARRLSSLHYTPHERDHSKDNRTGPFLHSHRTRPDLSWTQPPELAHPSLPLVTKMIQEHEDTCGHLKGAQEPPSLHRLGVSYPSLLGSEKNPRMRQYVLAAMATMNGEFIIASKCDNLQEASLNISATSATFLAI